MMKRKGVWERASVCVCLCARHPAGRGRSEQRMSSEQIIKKRERLRKRPFRLLYKTQMMTTEVNDHSSKPCSPEGGEGNAQKARCCIIHGSPPAPSKAVCSEYRELCKEQSRQEWYQAAFSLVRISTNKSSSHFFSSRWSAKQSPIYFQITWWSIKEKKKG